MKKIWVNGPFSNRGIYFNNWSFGLALRFYYEDYNMSYYYSVHLLFWEIYFATSTPSWVKKRWKKLTNS